MGSGTEARFAAYVEDLSAALGHADRTGPFRDYCLGLLMPVERKSVEPLAAVTAPARVAAQHQSLLHFVGQGGWSDDRVLAKVRDIVLPAIERNGAIEAWIIDDTGFPKKGKHSVGVTRQYCGQLGKQDNCQVAVSLSVSNHAASLPIAYGLYLPEDWAADPVRRAKAGVPDDVVFQTKPQIALDQIRKALAAGIPARRRADGRRLRRRHRLTDRDHGPGPRLCGRHPAAHEGVAPRPRTASAQALDGAGSTDEPDATR